MFWFSGRVWLIRGAEDPERSDSLQPDQCSKASSNWTSREERSCSCDRRQILWGPAIAPQAARESVFECKQPASQIQLRNGVQIRLSLPFTLQIDVPCKWSAKQRRERPEKDLSFSFYSFYLETAVFKADCLVQQNLCLKKFQYLWDRQRDGQS